MPTKSVPGRKLRDLIILHGFYQPSLRELGNLLRLSSSTVKKYLRAFKTSSLSLTEIQRLSDPALQERLKPLRSDLQNYRHDKIRGLLPSVHQRLKECDSTLLQEWESYRERETHSYSYSQFAYLYSQWLLANGLQKPSRNRWKLILSPENLEILREWRSSSNKRKWERAVALLGLHNECTMKSICGKLERAPKTIKKWRHIFLSDDLSELEIPSKRAVDKPRLSLQGRRSAWLRSFTSLLRFTASTERRGRWRRSRPSTERCTGKLFQEAWYPSTSKNSDTSLRRPEGYLRAQTPIIGPNSRRSRPSCRGSALGKNSFLSMSSVPVRSSGVGAVPLYQPMRSGRYPNGNEARAASSVPLLLSSRRTKSRTSIRRVRIPRR